MYSTARETDELVVSHMELSRSGFVRLHLTTYIFSANFLSDVQKSHRPNISQHKSGTSQLYSLSVPSN